MKIQIISAICSILQIAGLVLILLDNYSHHNYARVLIGIAGFAAIVNYFLPGTGSNHDKFIRPLAALAGLGIIVIACIR